MKSLSDLTSQCIRCGFCLESCPTFVVTGKETDSPRGRIYLIRSAEDGVLPWDEELRRPLDSCLGCRACEPACPSGVQYGHILELARDRLEGAMPRRPRRALLKLLSSPRLLRWALAVGKLWPSRRLPAFLSRLIARTRPEVDAPRRQPGAWPPEEPPKPGLKPVFLLDGCAMRELFPRVHEATRRLLRRVGFETVEVESGCCGALHAHNGDLAGARALALALAEAVPAGIPIVTDSAGCGSAMKDYAQLSQEPALQDFAGRAFDASEFLAREGLAPMLAKAAGLRATVAYHDACHLAHGQRIRSEPRSLIDSIPGIDRVDLVEADMCCGSAGIYNLVQPEMARVLLDRKWGHVEATDASILVSGNPGCHSWLAQASREHGRRVQVLHTMELLEAAFSGLPD